MKFLEITQHPNDKIFSSYHFLAIIIAFLQHVVSVAMTFVNKNGSRNYIVMCPCNLFCCIYDSEYTFYLILRNDLMKMQTCHKCCNGKLATFIITITFSSSCYIIEATLYCFKSQERTLFS